MDENAEHVLRALRDRRSVPKVREQLPPRGVIEQIIASAAWAPNHYLTEPWRFIVLAGSARERLGEVLAASLRAELPQPDAPDSVAAIERERRKPLRAPIVIAVAAVPSDSPKVREVEEIAAVAASIENMLITAHALGLGAMWRTGKPAFDPSVKRYLGLPESAHILAFVYLGYPDIELPPRQERDALAKAMWLGWDESGEL